MKRRMIGVLVLAAMLVSPAAYAAEDILIADFESKDYGATLAAMRKRLARA